MDVGSDNFLRSHADSIVSGDAISWVEGRTAGASPFPFTPDPDHSYFGPTVTIEAIAARPALELAVGPTPNIFNFNTTRGWKFRTNKDVLVTAFGLWDHHGNGFATPHEMLLWSENGTLLRRETMPAGVIGPASRAGARGLGASAICASTSCFSKEGASTSSGHI